MVSEIAYDLGFEYPQNFSRLFKFTTGLIGVLIDCTKTILTYAKNNTLT